MVSLINDYTLFGATDDEMIQMLSIKLGKENNQKISETLFYSQVSKIKYIYNLFWCQRMIFFIDTIVMPSSFLFGCLLDDNSIFVDPKLRLYSMSFLLSRIVCFPFPFLCGSWYLLFYVELIKAINPGKYFSTSCGVFNLLVMLYIF